jgi:hypothetical protein
MLMALAKTWAAIPKKDCPGWAALPANQKITLQLGSREDRGALMFWLPAVIADVIGDCADTIHVALPASTSDKAVWTNRLSRGWLA